MLTNDVLGSEGGSAEEKNCDLDLRIDGIVFRNNHDGFDISGRFEKNRRRTILLLGANTLVCFLLPDFNIFVTPKGKRFTSTEAVFGASAANKADNFS
jgi:hypothetical protein